MFGDLIINLLASFIFSILILLFFDIDKLKHYLSKVLPFSYYRTFDRISKREHVLKCFKEIFIDYSYKNGGKILLMSNTGGYPEYNPYNRIIELSTNDNIIIYLSIVRTSFKDFYNNHPNTANELIRNPKIKVYIFDNLIPYKFRIGINTDIKIGFFCGYQGHRADSVNLEGIKTSNDVILEALERLYMGLLSNGTELTTENLNSLIGK